MTWHVGFASVFVIKLNQRCQNMRSFDGTGLASKTAKIYLPNWLSHKCCYNFLLLWLILDVPINVGAHNCIKYVAVMLDMRRMERFTKLAENFTTDNTLAVRTSSLLQ